MALKNVIIRLAVVLAIFGGGFAAAKFTGRGATCDSTGTNGMKDCEHHKGGESAALSPGHHDHSTPGATAAPPLEDKVLAKGKAADCPYITQAQAVPGGRPAKDKTISDLEKFVLEGSVEGGKAR